MQKSIEINTDRFLKELNSLSFDKSNVSDIKSVTMERFKKDILNIIWIGDMTLGELFDKLYFSLYGFQTKLQLKHEIQMILIREESARRALLDLTESDPPF